MIDPIKGFDNAVYIPSTIDKKNDVQPDLKETPALYYETSKIGDYSHEIENYTTIKDWEKLEKDFLPTEEEMHTMARNGYNVENLTKEEIQSTTYSVAKGGSSKKNNQIKSEASQNEEKVDQLLKKIRRLKEHQDSMYTYAMSQKGSLTINSLYKASFSGSNKKQGISYDASEVKKLLDKNGMKPNEGNMNAASKLLELGLEVSQQDILKIQNIQTAVDGLDETKEADKAAEALGSGKKLGKEPLMEEEKILYSEKDIQDIVDEMTQVDEEDIHTVLNEGKEITIGNLKEAMYKNTQKVLKKALPDAGSEVAKEVTKGQALNVEEQPLEGVAGKAEMEQAVRDMENSQNKGQQGQGTKEEKAEQVKAQINEIRARLNVEAAQKLSARMPLESTELAKVAEALIAIEEEQVTEVMKQVDLPPTEENKTLLKEVIQTTNSMAVHKDLTTEVGITSEEKATLEEYQGAINAYEENFSVAEKRFGETTAKVTGQIENFLKANDLPQDELTIEAAKALIASGMELTKENLMTGTAVVLKLNTFLEEMTPYRAANMIKEGLNPYKASINDILKWVEVERLPQLKNSIAETIVALEDKHQITEEQKQGLVGLYKILSRVEKSKDDVTGYLLKNELPLTLEKLEEATKYIGKNTHVEKRVDDEFGTLEELKYDKQTAKQMIYEAKEENEKLIQIARVLETMQLPITDENKDKFSKLQHIIYPFIKESVKKELGKFEGLETLPPSLIQKIDAIKHVNPELIQVMEKQQIPVTISNVYWMQELVKNPNAYADMLDEHQLAKEGFPKSFEAVEEEIKDLEIKAKEIKEAATDKGDMGTYRDYKRIEEMVHVQKELIQKEGVYQIPFIIQGETKLVQMYINKENAKKDVQKEGINVVIAYDTKNMGTITTAINLKGDSLSYAVSTPKEEASILLDDMKKDLQKLLDQIGYTVIKDNYHSEKEEKIVHPTQVVKRGESYFEEIV